MPKTIPMRRGFLEIEARGDRPGLIHLFGIETESAPAPEFPPRNDRPRLLYCAFFHDLDAALMHTHEAIMRRLVDLDQGLYRVDALDAVAAAQSVELRHWQTYIDAELADDPRLADRVAYWTRRKKRSRLRWNLVAIVAIVLFLLRLGIGL